MASNSQTDSITNTIKENFELLNELQVDDLVRENELGTQLSFKSAEPIILKTLELYKRAEEVPLNEVPTSLLLNFNKQLSNALSTLQAIKNFNANQSNPIAARDALIQQLENQYDAYRTQTLPLLTVKLLHGNDLSIKEAKLDDLIETLETRIQEANNKGVEYLDQLNKTLKIAEETAAKVGVSRHSQIFMVESNEHEKQAKTWLFWTFVVLLLVIVSAALFITLFPKSSTSNAEIIQYTITKVIVLTALFYGLTVCNKNYKAHKHNATLNKHRQNALSTFEAFSNAAGEDVITKNAILLEATHTIFSNQQTGYLTTEQESESSSKIVEIIKNVTSTKE